MPRGNSTTSTTPRRRTTRARTDSGSVVGQITQLGGSPLVHAIPVPSQMAGIAALRDKGSVFRELRVRRLYWRLRLLLTLAVRGWQLGQQLNEVLGQAGIVPVAHALQLLEGQS
jgi:hypothetical protein